MPTWPTILKIWSAGCSRCRTNTFLASSSHCAATGQKKITHFKINSPRRRRNCIVTWRNSSFIVPLNRFGLPSITPTVILCRPHRLHYSRILHNGRGSVPFFIICWKGFVSSLGCLRLSCRTPQRSYSVSLGSKKPTEHIAFRGAYVSRQVTRLAVQPFFSRASNHQAKHRRVARGSAKSLGADR